MNCKDQATTKRSAGFWVEGDLLSRCRGVKIKKLSWLGHAKLRRALEVERRLRLVRRRLHSSKSSLQTESLEQAKKGRLFKQWKKYLHFFSHISKGTAFLELHLGVSWLSESSSAAYCQRASRAKTRGWWGGSIIEPCESTVLAEKISSV